MLRERSLCRVWAFLMSLAATSGCSSASNFGDGIQEYVGRARVRGYEPLRFRMVPHQVGDALTGFYYAAPLSMKGQIGVYTETLVPEPLAAMQGGRIQARVSGTTFTGLFIGTEGQTACQVTGSFYGSVHIFVQCPNIMASVVAIKAEKGTTEEIERAVFDVLPDVLKAEQRDLVERLKRELSSRTEGPKSRP